MLQADFASIRSLKLQRLKSQNICSSTHPHENSSATSVYIEKDEFRERRTGAPEFMADRIII